jgi:hypothetical protein
MLLFSTANILFYLLYRKRDKEKNIAANDEV